MNAMGWVKIHRSRNQSGCVSDTLRDIVAANIELLSARSWKEITGRVLCGQFIPPSLSVKPARTRKSAGRTTN
jgi:hypothetical protein